MINPETVTLCGEDVTHRSVKLHSKKDAVLPMAELEDLDSDRDLDLVVHLETERFADYDLDTICELGASTWDGYVVSGSDSVRIIPE